MNQGPDTARQAFFAFIVVCVLAVIFALGLSSGSPTMGGGGTWGGNGGGEGGGWNFGGGDDWDDD